MMFAILASAMANDFIITHKTNMGETIKVNVNSNDNLRNFRELIQSKGLIEKTLDNPILNLRKSEVQNNLLEEIEAGDIINLNIILEYPENLMPVYIQYGGEIGGQYFFYEGADRFTIELEYNPSLPNIFFASFYSLDADNPDDIYVIFYEFEKIEDRMNITFDANEATECFDYNFLNIDGNPFKLVSTEYNPETEEYTLIGDGDIIEMFGMQLIYYKEYLNLFTAPFFLYDTYNVQTGVRTEKNKPNKIWINKLPMGCGMTAQYIANTPIENIFYAGQMPCVSEATILTTSIEDYAVQSFKFIPFITSEYDITNKYGITIQSALKGTMMGGINSYYLISQKNVDDPFVNIVIKSSLPNVTNEGIDVYQGTGFASLVEQLEEYTTTGITSAIYTCNNKDIIFHPLNTSRFGSENIYSLWTLDFDNWFRADWTKFVNPYLSQNPDFYRTIMGNTIPTNSFLGMFPESDQALEPDFFPLMFSFGFFSYGYMGRNNEARTLDQVLSWVNEEQLDNIYQYTIINDNTLIDGEIPGSNVTVLGCQMLEPDFVPPTMQYLAIFDDEGFVNDRFDSTEDTWFEFWAGDFFYEPNEDWTEDRMGVRPLESVTVEYAPYGTEDYMPLDVTENPDKFFMPGYGYCFEGSLASVGNTEGWYDMRFSLTDASGNYQIQTLSPAFYISAQASGINSPSALKGKVSVSGNSIIAPDGAEIYAVSGVKSSGKNLLPGVYIVRLGSESIKCIIR